MATSTRSRHPARPAPPEDAPDAEQRQPGLLEIAVQELLAVTAWYTPSSEHEPPSTITVRFTGQLHEARPVDAEPDVDGPGRADRFSCDETFELVTGPGPVALTARIRDLTPGTWSVHAIVVGDLSGNRPRRRKTAGPPKTSLPVTPWSLRQRPKLSPDCPLQTHLPPFAVAPGVVPIVWAATAIVGIAAGLAAQQVLAGRVRPDPGPVLAISLTGIVAGILGAKVWFVVLHRAEHRREGWCIQGFLTGFIVAAGLYLLAAGTPAGLYLATAAPGLLLGLAIGRVGCFFAGCCSGRPTSSRWGVWSSDQRIGTKRLPTQLMESSAAFAVAVGAGLTVALGESSSGWVFVAAVAGYTAIRQAVLKMRGEPRQSTVGPLAAAAVAVVALVAAVTALTL